MRLAPHHLLLTTALLLSACGAPPTPALSPAAPAAAPVARAPITFRDLLAQDRVKADHRVAYGSDPLQFGELWLPTGRGPHPTVVLIHGGCWRADLPGLELMDYMAEALRREGVAVWNLEYRRIGGPGGGYPGTFTDVSAGVDHLRRLAPTYKLDLDRVALAGHSAGGHLALWAATRSQTPKASPLHPSAPLPVRGVVTLAGINDLSAYRTEGPTACGGPETIDSLIGAGHRPAGDLFADTSPAAFSRSGVRQAVISGALDPIVPPRFGQAYAKAAAAKGDPVEELTFPAAGHFELIDPTSTAWPQVRDAMLRLLGGRGRSAAD